MKKLLIVLLIPVLIFGAVVYSRVKAHDEIDYDIYLGNNLSSRSYDMSNYVETPDKDQINYNIDIPETFEEVPLSDGQGLELFVEEETLAIAVRTENGYVYSSYPLNDGVEDLAPAVGNSIRSGVSLDLFINSQPVSISYLDSVNDSLGNPVAAATSIIVNRPQQDGFTAKVDFNHPFIKIRFDLVVRVDEGNLVVEIPYDSIDEYNENLWNNSQDVTYYLLRNIIAFQFFGATESETDGYVMVPDGSGALITLESDPDKTTSVNLDVWGEDLGYMSPSFDGRQTTIRNTERLTMPVFGMFHDVDRTGFYTIVEGGVPYAQYNFKSTGIINDYYTSFFNFRYRQSYEQFQSRSNENQFRITLQENPNVYDASMRYVFLQGEEANYVGMAKSYRDYLIENGDLGDVLRQNYSVTPTKVDFIGAEVEMGILSLGNTEITRYEEISQILTTLQNDGYNELVTSLKTYNMDEMGYRFGVYRQLGGRGDFRDLLEYLDENNIEFSYYLDYVRSQKQFSRQHAQTLSKREIYHVELSSIFFAHTVNETDYYLGYAEDDLGSLERYGIENIALAGLDRSLYTSWDDRVKFATENIEEILAMLSFYEENNISTALHLPDTYMYRYASAYYDAPISSSDYSFVAASIPFVQLVVGKHLDMFSSHLNFASDEAITLLRMVEFGVYPSFVLSGGSTYDLKLTNSSNVYISEYEILQNRMGYYYQFISGALDSVVGQEIVDHTYTQEGVVVVAYANGVEIVINYNSEEITELGTTVAPLSYEVIS